MSRAMGNYQVFILAYKRLRNLVLCVVQKEDDIVVWVFAVDIERKELCLNTLTGVECTYGHCPCDNMCQVK